MIEPEVFVKAPCHPAPSLLPSKSETQQASLALTFAVAILSSFFLAAVGPQSSQSSSAILSSVQTLNLFFVLRTVLQVGMTGKTKSQGLL